MVTELAPQQQRADREQRVLDHLEQEVDAVDQLGPRQRKAPRLGGELARVRVRTDCRRLEATGARDHDAARHHLQVDRLVDRVRLARQQRLVDLEAIGGAHDAVGRHLIAGTQLEQVVEHHVLDRNFVQVAVADGARLRRAEHGQTVQRALGPDLLHDPDQRVGDEHDPEQPVLRLAENQDDDEENTEDRVETSEDVGADDLAVRPARALAGSVRLAARDPLRDLRRREAVGRRLESRGHGWGR